MSGSTETQFTATGPASIGFQTQPPDTNTQLSVGVEVSGLSLGVKGTGTGGEANRTTTGFEVRAKTAAKNAAFSYRVVARRRDLAPARFAEVKLPASLEEVKARSTKPPAAR